VACVSYSKLIEHDRLSESSVINIRQWGIVDLSNAEIEELNRITSDIHSISCRMNASICFEQSRSMWLKEGDMNYEL
jgi:hypothetical protein